MLILTETTDTIEIVLGGAVTTNELPVVVSWRDVTTTTFLAGRTPSDTNGATPVTILASPAASTQRCVDYILVRNEDTVAQTVTVTFDDNSTPYTLTTFTLDPGEQLQYTDANGWQTGVMSGGGGGGSGDVVGPASATDDRIAAFDGVTGKLIKESTVTATSVASHLSDTANPHATDVDNLGSGTLAELNTAITDATLDDSGDSRPPSGTAGGDLNGTFPNPSVDDGADSTALHDNQASEISAITNKASPAGGDFLVIEDSAAANVKKHILISSLPSGSGDVTGPASSVDDRMAAFDGVTGKLIKEGTVTASSVASHLTDTANPHATDIENLGSGTLAELNAAITDATLDDSGDSRPPNGTAGGDLNGTYPNPLVDDGADATAIHDNIPHEIDAILNKATPIGADVMLIEDSADDGDKKHILISALPAATPATHAASHQNGGGDEINVAGLSGALADNQPAIPAAGLDTTALHNNVSSEISAIANKAAPAGGDFLVIEDSAAANVKKHILVSSLPTGSGDVTGPASSTDDRMAAFDGVTGKLIKEGTVTASSVASHLSDTANPHATDVDNLGSGTLAELNTAITDATLDDSGDSRPPDGTAGGDLNGTYPNPLVDDGADSTALHDNIASEISAITNKASPVGGDFLVIEDSAAGNIKKHILVSSLPGGGDVTGPASSVDDRIAAFDSTTGKLIKESTVTASSVASHLTDTANPHATDIENLGSGTLAELNAAITDATLDDSGDARPPNGTAGGDLNGTYPNPLVDDGADATAIHDNVASEISAITNKVTPVSGDFLVIEDSAAGNVKKHITIGSLPGGGGDPLSTVLSSGNTTGGTDLEVDGTDSIILSSSATSQIHGDNLTTGTNIQISGGNSSSGVGGSVSIISGTSAGSNNGGTASLQAGNASISGVGGAVSIGSGNGQGTSNGGLLHLLAGAALSTSSGTGGKVDLDGGTGPTGGWARLRGGASNATTNGAGGGGYALAGAGKGTGTGGPAVLASGAGGATGSGGLVQIVSGAGGATSGISGDISLTTGSTTSGDVGDIILASGAATGGDIGVVRITNTALEFIEATTVPGPTIIATQGRYWVRDDAPNTPMFTDDAGTDFDLTAGAPPPATMTEVDADITTTSGTDVVATSMTVTPASGTYTVWFAGTIGLSTNNSAGFCSIHSAGAQVAASERHLKRGAGQGDVYIGFSCMALVTVNGSQAIEGQWRVDSGTGTMYAGRQLLIVEVA